MGKIASKRRSFEIKKRGKRGQELAKLRKIYSQAKTKAAKEKVLKKVLQIAPHLSPEEFLAPLAAKRAISKLNKKTKAHS